jgi:glycosyltransferase involved in cell wall biosynthesis
LIIISSRYPSLGSHGDQSLLFSYLLYLGRRHEVTLVTVDGAPSPAVRETVESLAQVVVLGASRFERASSALAAALRGQPAQVGWMMPGRAWRRARRIAHDGDVALVVTSRSCRGALPVPTVIDHIDALSFNMANRARGPESLPVRMFARFEAWRMRAWEQRLRRLCVAQLGTSREVVATLPSGPPTYVLPASYAHVIEQDAPAHERDIDLVLTGDMRYPPNRQAADLLINEILPRILRERPQTRTWIVGRSASRVVASNVTTASDVPDLHAYLRRAKVAIAPIAGAGSPFKTLEAAANGAALVATRWAVECYRLPAAVASDPDGFAREALRLLEDQPARQEQADAARRVAQTLTTNASGERLQAILQQAAGPTLKPSTVD